MTGGIEVGATLETAMLSPCVGGFIRTWTASQARLWSVDHPEDLTSVMGQGLLARTLREERRYREVGLLIEASNTLVLQPRQPVETDTDSMTFAVRQVHLTPADAPSAAKPPLGAAWPDLERLLGAAVRYTVEVDGFLVVERGGWDAPLEPYCLFIVVDDGGPVSMVETAPLPIGAPVWAGHFDPSEAGATMTAPATPDTIAAAPRLIVDACQTWGVEPWDLALTYGQKP